MPATGTHGPRHVWTLVICLATLPVAADSPKGGWAKAETNLKNAVVAESHGVARRIVGELARTGEPKGIQLIIKYALTGKNHELTAYAAGRLTRVGTPELRREVYSGLDKSKKFRTRIILLAVVARWREDPAALTAIHGCLDDLNKPVVLTALRWIREIKKPERSVEPLVAELARRERKRRGRIYFDIQKTLTHLTGYEFEISADWANFWQARKSGIKLPPKRKDGVTQLYKSASFFSISVDTDRVVFIIDVSQSMEVKDPILQGEAFVEKEQFIGSGVTVVRRPDQDKGDGGQAPQKARERTRLSAVKKELVRTVQALPEYVLFTVISFNHEFAYFADSPALMQANRANKQRVVRWVQGFKPYGATRTDVVLREALRIRDVDTICLLTDGAPKTAKNEKIPPGLVYGLVKHENRFRKCRINTIGFLQAGRSMREFVTTLARQNDGECVLLE